MPIFYGFLDGDLFGPKTLDAYLEGRLAAATKAVEDTADTHLLADPEEVAGQLISRYEIEPLRVDYSSAEATQPSEGMDGEDRLSVIVPFTGDAELLRRDAHHRSIKGTIRAQVVEDTDESRIVYWVTGRPLTAIRVRNQMDETHQMLRSAIEWTNRLVADWNATLVTTLTDAARLRAARLARLQDLAANLPIPIRASRDHAVPIPVQPREMPARDLVAPVSRPNGRPEQWMLEEDIYEDVLEKLELFAAAVGRLPVTMAGLGEVDYRNIALVVLNSNFHLSGARGEVFNGLGKSDVAVPWRGRNAFIGEFKKWDGPKVVTDGVSQLFTYLTWHDTKAALVLFIKERNASELIEKADKAIRDHPLFEVTLPSPEPDTRRNYKLLSPTDDQRRVHLALLPVVITKSIPNADPDLLQNLQ
ncbi:hypothetical protein [Marmoricola sp. URHB0036]|uniref:hypothetical protein n=1 Tax=Marmoricola sp. URHB0036 TaxID=1298863 RepID=UPI00068614C3|nr:hypothetical protein [Marmoricola sp. URHB0036]